MMNIAPDKRTMIVNNDDGTRTFYRAVIEQDLNTEKYRYIIESCEGFITPKTGGWQEQDIGNWIDSYYIAEDYARRVLETIHERATDNIIMRGYVNLTDEVMI